MFGNTSDNNLFLTNRVKKLRVKSNLDNLFAVNF